MSYLGYDRGRIVALRRRLGDLADEAATLRVTDPVAGTAWLRYRDAAALLTGWRADLAAIDSCGFSSPYQPVRLDPADPSLVDLLHPDDAAWTTVTDPRAATAANAADHARHLAEYLATVDIDQVLGDDQRTGELARLVTAAMAGAAGRDLLLQTLGAVRFTTMAEDLAQRVAQRGASTEAARQAAGAALVLQSLAHGLGAAQRARTVDAAVWNDQLGERTDPYAAALVVGAAGLGAADLAVVAVAAWRRWGRRAGDDIDERAAADEQTPAVLLSALTAQPLAARRALEAFDADDLGLLFGPSIDSTGVLAVLLASADPHVGASDDVERSMVNVLGFLADHQDLAGASGVADGLGAYAGPYLEHLVGECDASGYPARRWDLHGATPAALLGWIAHSNVAAVSLQAYLDALVLARFAELATATAFDGQLVHHLGAIAGAVDAMVAEARVLRAEHQNVIWQATTDAAAGLLAGTATGGLAGGGVTASRLLSASISSGMTWVFGRWQANGGLGAPAPVAETVAAEGDSIEQRRGRREAGYLAAVFSAAVSAGTMPASATPPPYAPDEPYLATRNRWLGAAADPADAAARQRLWQAAEAFDAGMSGALNPYPSPDACA